MSDDDGETRPAPDASAGRKTGTARGGEFGKGDADVTIHDLRRADFWLREGAPTPWTQAWINVFAVLVPAIGLAFAVGQAGSLGAALAALPSVIGSRRSGIGPTAPLVLVAGLAGALTLQAPEWAPAIGAALALASGVVGRRGWAGPMVICVAVWSVFSGPILTRADTVPVMASYVLGMIWALGVIRVTRAPTGRANAGSRSYAAVFGVLFASGIAFSAWLGQHRFGEHGFWFPLTVALLSLPPHTRYFTRAAKRVIGTAFGCGLAFAFAALHPPAPLLLLAAFAGFVFMMRIIPQSQLIGSAAISFALVALLSQQTPIRQVAIARLDTIAAAGALAILLGGIGVVLLRRVDAEALESIRWE